MRTFLDTSLSLIALLVLSPLLVLLAVAIVIDSPGNPFYLAPRVGRGGRVFRMCKFRTMVAGAARLGPAITARGDARVTRLGRMLRATKLDELPQFVNVLRGEMSLIGPRPESPELVAFYTPEQRAILAFKPGVTGFVQLASGDESQNIPESVDANDYYRTHLMGPKLEADMAYLRRRTLRSDLQLLSATAGYVLRCLVR